MDDNPNCHANTEADIVQIPTLVAFEEDTQSPIEEARVALTRAGINVSNSQAYIRALDSELSETMKDLNHARKEHNEFEREFGAAFARFQSMNHSDHPEDVTRL